MEQHDGIKRRKKATHLTFRDRTDIETIIRINWPHGKRIVWAQLGRYMGRSWRIVKSEYLRGRVINRDSELVEYKTYSAEKGQAERIARVANRPGPAARAEQEVHAVPRLAQIDPAVGLQVPLNHAAQSLRVASAAREHLCINADE